MIKIFAATILPAVLAVSTPVWAQGSNTGEPNSLHGSGDMMQDGPHASANPYDAAESSLPSGRANARYDTKKQACEAKWRAVQRSGGSSATHMDFLSVCMNRP